MTNACDAFGSQLNAQFYTLHPNIFVFFTVLKEVQIDTELLIQTASRKNEVLRKRAAQKMDYMENKINE